MSDARKILNALGSVDEKFIEEAAEPEKLNLHEHGFETVHIRKKASWKLWGGCAAAAVAVAVGIGALSGGLGSGKVMTAESLAVNKEMAMDSVLTAAAEMPAEEAFEVTEESEYVIDLAAGNGNEKNNESEAAEAGTGLVLASVDNSAYLEKCRSNGLAAGAPIYPETLQNPDSAFDTNNSNVDWDAYSKAGEEYSRASKKKQQEVSGYEEPLKAFTEITAKEFLEGQENNGVYSPLNVYMALSMLAELTDGDSRQQLLDLLGLKDLESVREEAKKLWLASYTDDGLTTLLLGSGVWVDDDFDINYEALDTLVEKYYAFYVTGDIQSEEMAQSFRDWLSDQTKGLLDDFISEEKFEPETVLALATTIYYKAHWQDVFEESATEDAVFHAVTGDQTVPFMNQQRTGSVMWGDNFTAASKNMAGNETMYFILPDEGCTVDQVLANDQLWSMLDDGNNYENTNYGCVVTMSIPKFDVSSGADLADGLRSLGVTDIFDACSSDFSRLTSQDGLSVGQVSHNARVKIDEEGVEAAAYTAVMLSGCSMPTEYVDFVCDRPFIFVIKNTDGAVLFMGTVNSIK